MGTRKVGIVYFIEDVSASEVKIGYTANWPGYRLMNLGCERGAELRVVGLMPGMMRDEKALHRLFHGDRIKGEWFRKSEALWTYIRAIPYQGPQGLFLKSMLGYRVLGHGPVRQRIGPVEL